MQRISSYLDQEEITPYVEYLPKLSLNNKGVGGRSIKMMKWNFLRVKQQRQQWQQRRAKQRWVSSIHAVQRILIHRSQQSCGGHGKRQEGKYGAGEGSHWRVASGADHNCESYDDVTQRRGAWWTPRCWRPESRVAWLDSVLRPGSVASKGYYPRFGCLRLRVRQAVIPQGPLLGRSRQGRHL